jgi:hypothetical protein
LLSRHITNKLVREEKLDTGGDRGVDDPFGGIPLRYTSGNTIHDTILTSECVDERVERLVVDCLVGDIGVGRCSIRGGLTSDCSDLDVERVFVELSDDRAANVPSRLF